MTTKNTTPAGARTQSPHLRPDIETMKPSGLIRSAVQDGALDVRVGRFVSKYSDEETYRLGVKDHRSFRAVHYTDERGQKLARVCLIETPADRNCDEHTQAISKVLALLNAGDCAFRDIINRIGHSEMDKVNGSAITSGETVI